MGPTMPIDKVYRHRFAATPTSVRRVVAVPDAMTFCYRRLNSNTRHTILHPPLLVIFSTKTTKRSKQKETNEMEENFIQMHAKILAQSAVLSLRPLHLANAYEKKLQLRKRKRQTRVLGNRKERIRCFWLRERTAVCIVVVLIRKSVYIF